MAPSTIRHRFRAKLYGITVGTNNASGVFGNSRGSIELYRGICFGLRITSTPCSRHVAAKPWVYERPTLSDQGCQSWIVEACLVWLHPSKIAGKGPGEKMLRWGRISVPFSSRWVAKECLSVWTVTRLERLAAGSAEIHWEGLNKRHAARKLLEHPRFIDVRGRSTKNIQGQNHVHQNFGSVSSFYRPCNLSAGPAVGQQQQRIQFGRRDRIRILNKFRFRIWQRHKRK
ncbi:hypothetical protein FBZ99_12221 [Rhizobium sp. ERR 1071]|nr:hypothetical protein FBZ99_12221 [Rhizobium sp. ERR1071]